MKQNKQLKYLSLFSGIGGFELGIADKGECIGYSEINKYAIQIYEKHFNHKNYGDITKIIPKDLPDFDLLVGGFPCQSFSIAGKRMGFADTRGTLFFDIAKIIREKQPRLLLLENVKGLLSHDKGATFFTIISTLDELGYDCQWQVLNSKNHGVPQNRERVFIIGHLRGTSRPKVFPIGGTDRTSNGEHKTKNIQNRKQERTDATNKDYAICLTAQQREAGRGVNHIRVEQINNPANKINVIGKLNSKTWEKRHESIRRVYSIEGISPTIPTAQGGGVMNKIMIPNSKIRRLTPIECERLQGFPDQWTSKGINEKGEEVEISDTQRYKTLGNAVSCPVITAIIKKLINNYGE